MWRVALENLRVRKVRTLLSLLGLAIAVAGVIGLVSLSAGITNTLRNSLQMIRGVVVIQASAMDPIFSRIDADLVDRLRQLPQVRAAAGEVWMLAMKIEGQSTLTKGVFSPAGLGGMQDGGRASLSDGGFYRTHLAEGRWVREGDRDVVVLSRQIASEYGKSVGDDVRINTRTFRLIGLYDTGSLFLDRACIIPFAQAAAMRGYKDRFISTVYVEPHDRSPAGLEATAMAIREHLGPESNVDALTPKRWLEHLTNLLTTMDVFLLAVSSFACIVGAVGVVNTMLMSVSERTREFGILKAVGWTRGDIARLVVVEAMALGVLGGAAGTVLGLCIVAVLKGLLPFEPTAPLWVVAVGFGGAVALGVLGGLYPAWRAASMDPVKAIRWE